MNLSLKLGWKVWINSTQLCTKFHLQSYRCSIECETIRFFLVFQIFEQKNLLRKILKTKFLILEIQEHVCSRIIFIRSSAIELSRLSESWQRERERETNKNSHAWKLFFHFSDISKKAKINSKWSSEVYRVCGVIAVPNL